MLTVLFFVCVFVVVFFLLFLSFFSVPFMSWLHLCLFFESMNKNKQTIFSTEHQLQKVGRLFQIWKWRWKQVVGEGGGGSDLGEKMISKKGQTVTKGSEKCSCIVLLFFGFSFNKSVDKTVLSCTILLFKQASFLTFCVLASFKVCWLLAPFFPVFLFLSFNFESQTFDVSFIPVKGET